MRYKSQIPVFNQSFFAGIIFFISQVVTLHSQKCEPIYQAKGEGDYVIIVTGYNALQIPIFEKLSSQLEDLGLNVILYEPCEPEQKYEIEDYFEYTIQDRIDEIEYVRKSLGVKKWHILAVGLGSMISCYYVTDYPNQVDKMIFISPWLLGNYQNGRYKTYKEKVLDYKISWAKQYPDASFEELYGGSIRRTSHKHVHNPQYINIVEESLLMMIPEINLNVLNDEFIKTPPDKFFLSRSFTDKILILHGEIETHRAYAKKERQDFVAVFDNPEVSMISGSGPFVWIEN